MDSQELADFKSELRRQAYAARDIAWRAQVRLCKRFQKMIARGKNANIVVTAIARELAAFMWAIAKQVPVAA